MGLFSKKDEQADVYKVYSSDPKDPNNTTVVYTPDKESARKEADKLGERENNVKVKKVGA